jgi:20S proteasome subunit beta 2
MEITDKTQMKSFVQSAIAEDTTSGGFDFDLYTRNQQLSKTLGGGATTLPTAWKTGTTIVGIVIKDGIVLGADTRATGGAEV